MSSRFPEGGVDRQDQYFSITSYRKDKFHVHFVMVLFDNTWLVDSIFFFNLVSYNSICKKKKVHMFIRVDTHMFIRELRVNIYRILPKFWPLFLINLPCVNQELQMSLCINLKGVVLSSVLDLVRLEGSTQDLMTQGRDQFESCFGTDW